MVYPTACVSEYKDGNPRFWRNPTALLRTFAQEEEAADAKALLYLPYGVPHSLVKDVCRSVCGEEEEAANSEAGGARASR